MRLLKQTLILGVLSLAFYSCEDKTIENYINGTPVEFTVSIIDDDYEVVTVHKSYFDPDYVPDNSGAYIYGLKILLKINDPSRRNEINRLVISSANKAFDFDKRELQESYVDSAGGYVFDLLDLNGIDSYSSSKVWSVALYNSEGSISREYPLVTSLNKLSFYNCFNDWVSESALEITFNNTSYELTPEAKVETVYLNTNGEEIGSSHSDLTNFKWIAADVPQSAVEFYYIATDKFSGVKRKFISGKYAIKDRLPDNLEYISGVRNPAKLELLQNTDKLLALSPSSKELTLFNYDDNSIVWQKQLSSVPIDFVYSPERKAIYLLYSGGEVDSINPADGSGKLIYKYLLAYRTLKYFALAGNMLAFFTQYSEYNVDFYNLNSRRYIGGYGFYPRYLYEAEYNPGNGRLYVQTLDGPASYFPVESNGEMQFKSSYGIHLSGEKFRNLIFSPDYKRIVIGEGYVLTCADSDGAQDLGLVGKINPLTDITFINEEYLVSIVQSYSLNNSKIPSSITIYNSNLAQLGFKSGLVGTPLKIYSKGSNLKVYSVYDNGVLIAEKFTVDGILNGSGSIKSRKIYKMGQL